MIEKRLTHSGEARYLVRIFKGVVNGKRRNAHRTFLTFKAAQQWEWKQKVALRDGTYVEPSKETLGAFLLDWLNGAGKMSVGDRTHHDDVCMVRRLVLGSSLADVRLGQLTTRDLERFYTALSVDRLGPRSVRALHVLLGKALKHAVRDRLIPANPARGATLPRMQRTEPTILTGGQLAKLLAVPADGYAPERTNKHQLKWRQNPWHALWHVLGEGGLRPSEALALKWEDVDFERGRLNVRRSLVPKLSGTDSWLLKEPKTARGRRTVPMPANSMDALRRHRARQLPERLAAGPAYRDLGLIFAAKNGAPLALNNLAGRHLHPLLDHLELPRIRLYDLRHTHVTLMLAAGVPVHEVAARVGHASAKMTLDVYAHALPHHGEDAVRSFSEFIVREAARA
jgi:integrase